MTQNNDEISENRRKGKTFRTCLRALLEASKGNSVYVVTYNHMCAKLFARHTSEMASVFLVPDFFKYTKHCITFKNKGAIKFISKDTYESPAFRGCQHALILKDY